MAVSSDGSVWCERCGAIMTKREGKFGIFFGCTGYPKCMRTKSLKDVDDEMTTLISALGPVI
jgi:ssDNA-binding Zn-finger/Zn-ribbon topoisomerase 1